MADDEPLGGTVEVDETYMGSKKYDKRRKRAKYDKEPVFGMIERDGRAKTYHVRPMNRWNVIGKIEDKILHRGRSGLHGRKPALQADARERPEA